MYLDNYFSTQFVEQLENYIRTDLMKLLRSCASDASFCGDDRLSMYILPGEEAHWRDSLAFAKVSGGFMPWGSERNEKMFLKKYWSSYKGKSFGVFDPPIVNVFYCKNRGIIGLGLVVAIVIDGLNPFWTAEKSPSDKSKKYMFSGSQRLFGCIQQF